jgi:hypothetical protein
MIAAPVGMPELSDRLGDEERALLAGVAAAIPAELQDRFALEVDRAGLWPHLFGVAATVSPAGRAGLAGPVRCIAAARPELVEQLAELAESHGLGDLVAEARATTG